MMMMMMINIISMRDCYCLLVLKLAGPIHEVKKAIVRFDQWEELGMALHST